jgi:hypothetical protein
MRQRIAITGSSTEPAESDSASGPESASGARGVLPRPTKRARSVSYEICAMWAPCTATRCSIQGGTSSCERARRVHSKACLSRAISVCTNRLLKAGCSSSEIAVASTTSAYVVISMVRERRERLPMRRRRNSTSSSAEIAISRCVS